MHYYICGYCGNSGKRVTKKQARPKCKCPGGNGKTYMEKITKPQFKSNKRNRKAMKRIQRENTST